MHFYIFSGSVFVSIIIKCWDLENSQKNMQNGVKIEHYHIFLLSILKKIVVVDFLFLSLSTCAWKPKVSGSSPAPIYVQR